MPDAAVFGGTNPGPRGVSVPLGEGCVHRQLQLDLCSTRGKNRMLSGHSWAQLTQLEGGKVRAGFLDEVTPGLSREDRVRGERRAVPDIWLSRYSWLLHPSSCQQVQSHPALSSQPPTLSFPTTKILGLEESPPY